jgi:release factor glutamine methyltransferase
LLRHNVTNRVSLVHTNLLDGIPESAELIVSNPPYVPERDGPHMQPEVIRYEPQTALFAGADGLDVIRRLFIAAFAHVAESGRLIVEFGLGQEDDLRGASREAGWTVDHIRRDLQGIPRVAVLRR